MNSTDNNDINDYAADHPTTDPVLAGLIEETPVDSIKDLWLLAKIYSGSIGGKSETHISRPDISRPDISEKDN